jgi:hypothetical protein
MWLPIATAPKRQHVLVNDTNFPDDPDWPKSTFACWIETEDWTGWTYEDTLALEACPDGPKPTHWFDLPPSP